MKSQTRDKIHNTRQPWPLGLTDEFPQGNGNGVSGSDHEGSVTATATQLLGQSAGSQETVELSQQPDAVLIELCLQGDQDAWAALLERYSKLIYSVVWGARLSPEDAADVFQSVALTLVERLKDLRDWSKLSSWLKTVTYNECMKVKQRKSKYFTSLEEMGDGGCQISSDTLMPDEAVQRREQQKLVRQALSLMDESGRRLLTHLFLEKECYSYKDIATKLGIPISSIGPKRGRSLKKLLQILTNLGL